MAPGGPAVSLARTWGRRMSRPHIDYVQSQALPWAGSPWPCLAGCQVKVLSRDEATGAASAVVRMPAGWHADGAGWLSAALEFLVVEGALEVNGREYRTDCYAWLPAGYPLRHCRSDAGAVLLAFFDAEPAWTAGVPDAPTADAPVEFRDAYRLPWTDEGLPPGPARAGVRAKLLRGSPARGDSTYLTACPAHLQPAERRSPQETHDCVEEIFLLSGDLQSTVGHMAAGAYAWLPSRAAHGPYGSRGGSLALVRTLGGPLDVQPTPHEVELEREPAYRPVLPPDFERAALRPWRPQRY